ncbi:MAG: hypothetical protein F2673_07385 [Actinobacteria bacterium]|nr:hypothetical protein [Actinomycetota bacterium]MSY12937.1 hypothetical protein [Actinomycetota bacterium]MSZ04504.1 hypothetical protein [Actinomycetota bacterium]
MTDDALCGTGPWNRENDEVEAGEEITEYVADEHPVAQVKRARWSEFPRSRKLSAFGLSAVLSLGIAFVIAGVFGSVTGRDQSRLPEEIEQLQPALGDKVLNQANIVVDLAPGYTGRLIVDDLVLRTVSTAESEPRGNAGSAPTTTIAFDPDTVRFDAGTNTLGYQPRPGGAIERFAVGRHLIKVIYWKLTESEVNSFSFTWYFDVSA